ncbi:PH domain-containing protein [Natronomonas halophila]|uniref:PH domain-containing protein n=1 Tax=Natronomonas halophila TaxID=2747817 RepID=UPI0015B63E31|nr:PH domain-containing protein [Natronomonas halophila]QLD85096.1 PH domain-containing protein [Natronomonas halophila]
MTDAWLTPEPGETVEWEASPRLMRALPAFLISLALVVGAVGGAVVVDRLAVAGLFVAPLPGAYAYLRVVNTRFVLTNRALYRKTGILGVDVRTVELDRVQNSKSSQGILGTAFGYGSVTVDVAGGSDLRYFDIYDPDEVRADIERLAGGSNEIPGTIEQWREVREELRAIRRLIDGQPK